MQIQAFHACIDASRVLPVLPSLEQICYHVWDFGQLPGEDAGFICRRRASLNLPGRAFPAGVRIHARKVRLCCMCVGRLTARHGAVLEDQEV